MATEFITSVSQLPDNKPVIVQHNDLSTNFTVQKQRSNAYAWGGESEVYILPIFKDYNTLPIKHLITVEEYNQLVAGKLIKAIKLFRERTGMGLKFSKDIIDSCRNWAKANKDWDRRRTAE